MLRGTFALSSNYQVIGPTGLIGYTGPIGITGATAINQVFSSTNSNIIYAYINSNGTIKFQNGSAITSITYNVIGTLVINIASGFFSSTPYGVICNAGASSSPPDKTGCFYNQSISSATQVTLYLDLNNTPAYADVSLIIIGPS